MTVRLITLVAVAALATAQPVYAQTSSQPGAAGKPAQATPKPGEKKPEPAKKTTAEKPKAKPAEATPAVSGDLDLAFGAYQRGYFITAFREASKRVTDANDPRAMTLLGELYAGGFGIEANEQKAVEWYRLAADRGDPNAMFALAMFQIGGRGGPKDMNGAAQMLASAAKHMRAKAIA